MTLTGRFQKGVVVLDEPAALPDGTPVNVEVLTEEIVTPLPPAALPRRGGQYAGRIELAPDFDEWPADFQDALGMAP